MTEMVGSVQSFFNEISFEQNISLIRHDGIVLYSNEKNDFKKQTVGALVSGVWQAAIALGNLSSKEDLYEFRFSFDTSENGVYILPIRLNNKEYYLSLIYNGIKNPAVLKNKLRNIRLNLIGYWADQNVSSEKSEFLFQNISDKEMDNMFQRMGVK